MKPGQPPLIFPFWGFMDQAQPKNMNQKGLSRRNPSSEGDKLLGGLIPINTRWGRGGGGGGTDFLSIRAILHVFYGYTEIDWATGPFINFDWWLGLLDGNRI